MRFIGGEADLDLLRYYPEANPSVRRFWTACSRNPGLLAVVIYRLQQRAYLSGHRARAERLRSLNLFITGADFVVGCQLGQGLLIHHPVGIVVGRGAVVGADCTLLQQTTLGERYADGQGDHSYPVVGRGVTIGAGAKVLGGVTIGSGASIGANSVVISDVGPNEVAVGVPAKIIPSSQENR